MKAMENNAFFWQKLDTLLMSNEIKIKHRKGERHPQFHGIVYPIDFGFLEGTNGANNSEIGIYVGSKPSTLVQAMVVGCDILSKTVEVVLVVGCSDEEIEIIAKFLNSMEFQKALLIRRGSALPDWDEE